ncbi:DUF1588 domain-containing protein [Planctomycetes bacterium TBK1r]|uniref:Planctomycete cytochrome C n=1 Tax=Stieleria magnilauensis TaxID=2527963 RepID=A0ABX5XUT7_9BACT|nr:hypothetical protein TBK1r_41290 [Planctomycetes bacterium TBK1r]
MKHCRRILAILLLCALLPSRARADLTLLKEHCAKCHSGDQPKGDFNLDDLGTMPDSDSSDYWISSLDRVSLGEMPPAKHNRMTKQESKRLSDFLRREITRYDERTEHPTHTPPRRLNNREFENSVRDVLLLDHVGTHDPLAMLLGDTLHDGFDTHGETLGMSEYHLDQYVMAIRNVLDNVIFTGPKPESRRYEATAEALFAVDRNQSKRADVTIRGEHGVELRDPRQRTFCENFVAAPASGTYRISFRATGVDRHVYSQDRTGIYDGDPLTLRLHLGNRELDYEMTDGKTQTFQVSVWLAEGTRLEFSHHTDGLRLIGNGNFKFQNRIAHDFIKANDPELYQRVLRDEVPKAKFRSDAPSHWVHWVPYWQGPRPAIESVTIEGPSFESWPPQRQIALLGQSPSAENAAAILKPIAQRAWRRAVTDDELTPIVKMVQTQANTLGDVEAIKEGIVAILVSPSFLLINPEDSDAESRFATKFSYLLGSTTPDPDLITQVENGKLSDFDSVRTELIHRIDSGRADEFLSVYPYSWLQLDRINFMAPDVDRYPFYEKKNISEDMVHEVLAFFRHAVETNRPVPELLTADYSFVNADLARVYGLDDVPSDSELRKFVFEDGRRGGFLGMGAFLTLTADTLSTSPIHRAVFVMENFMGIHPAPPPADVEIKEPDVRAAKTIREVLQAHQTEATCAACHQNIDPYGYAFENFDPIGAWRDHYIDVSQPIATTEEGHEPRKTRRSNISTAEIPIDASASFLSGARYKDITEFRTLMHNDANRIRFVRCFVTKLLTYANGIEPENFTEIEAIVERSAEHDYKILETMAAVIDSPLFRETSNTND